MSQSKLSQDEFNKINAQLKIDEGFRTFPYKCSAGKLTIGFGRNIQDNGISLDEACFFLKNDIYICYAQLSGIYAWFDGKPSTVKRVLINMCFNLGIEKLQQFKIMLTAIAASDYRLAAKNIRNSKYYLDVGARAERLAAILEQETIICQKQVIKT